jgi:hypothetical protein
VISFTPLPLAWTTWSKIFLEKVIFGQIFKKFPISHGTQKFIVTGNELDGQGVRV